MKVNHLTTSALDKELQQLNNDNVNILIMYNCVLKAMDIPENVSLNYIIDTFNQEKSFLKNTNDIYLSKIIQCMYLWTVYLSLSSKNKSIPGIHEQIIDVKNQAIHIWNEIST